MKKKKILLLSDDFRFHSGIATMSREIILGTIQKYEWVQMGGSVKHPDHGKILDMSESISKELNLPKEEVYCKIYPVNGYGTPQALREVMSIEKPDMIFHFTDPRFWEWLYHMEREIRNLIPLTYLNIWDDLPYPMWNRKYYMCSDGIFNITKQTHNIVKNVLDESVYKDFELGESEKGKKVLSYVPHGINPKKFRPLTDMTDSEKTEYTKIKESIKADKYDYIIFYNHRNIRRKMTNDILLSYKTFCDNLSKEEAKKCLLLMHTAPKDENGTDLHAVHQALCPDYNIGFSPGKISPEQMNMIYNMVDVTITISSNEGHGLSNTESMMAGTPTITNVTGGLQSQCGFVDENGEPIKFTREFGSNHRGKYKKHGKWVYPVFPSNISMQGSIPTPYIFDDRAMYTDVAEGMMYWYLMDKEKRNECGQLGRDFCLSDGFNSEYMCSRLIESIEETFKCFVPRNKFDIEHLQKRQPLKSHVGIVEEKIDRERLMEKINENR